MSTRATWQKLQIFKIQDGGRPPFWKSLNRHLSQKSSDSDEIWYTTSDIEPDYSHVKIEIFKIQGNRFFGHNSSTDCPISAKFCMRKQNGMSTRAKWQNLQIFKIQDGGRPPFRKSLNRHISLKNRPILMKFGRYTIANVEPDSVHVTKNWFFFKFKMAEAAILKITFLAITHRPIVRFQRNFAWGSRTACPQGLNDKICKY